ncbi:MAG: PLP-dependent transferase [Deltaproteobacteria bacterium]|nr:PLP-dependent transferase [Deltaproteobacteria bacterium]
MKGKHTHLDTKLIHASEPKPPIGGGCQHAHFPVFLENITLPISAPSLGGVESLITRPAATSHAGVPPEDRRAMGISDSLIRLSVGLEATEDLMEDFEKILGTL